MPAAIRSTAQFRKHSCVYELGKQRKDFPVLLKDWKTSHLPWTSQFQSVFFSVFFFLPALYWNVSGICNFFPLSTWAWKIIWCGLDNTVTEQPKTTSDLRDWKNYRRKASLKEKKSIINMETWLQKIQGNKALKSSSFCCHRKTAQPCSTQYISPHKSSSIKIRGLKVPPMLALSRAGPIDENYTFRKVSHKTGLYNVWELPLCKDFHRQLFYDKC